jgi:hypothetical protein
MKNGGAQFWMTAIEAGLKINTTANEKGSALASVKRIVEKTWLAAFVLVALLFIVSYFKGDKDKIAQILGADIRLLAAALATQITYFFVTVITWRKALFYSTGKTVGFWEGLSQMLMINFGKYIPGKIWGIAARGTRLKSLGYTLEEISRASYLDQVLLLLTGFWLAFLSGTLLYGNSLYIMGLLATSLVIIFFSQGSKIIGKIALPRLFDIRTNIAQVLTLSLGCTAIWLFLAVTFILFCTSIVGVELTPANVAAFVLSLTAGYLAGFLAIFAPGGVGVREGVGAVFLSSIVTLEEAVLLMLLFRVWIVFAELAAGAAVIARGMSGAAEADTVGK